MKHLLILISFLLLSSPVIGQETGVLYQYETSSGIQWKTFGDGKVQPKYKGEIKNGKMNGLGVLTYPYGGKSVVGEWKNGKEWNTKHRKKDGTLIGKYVNGESMGVMGVLFYRKVDGKWGWYRDGDEDKDWKYVGEIENGRQNGQGTSTKTDGSKIYVGDWKDGEMHGQGTFTYSDGKKYEGEWKNGKYHGQGTYTKPDGSKYVGGYKSNNRHGQGTYTKPDGSKYAGEWDIGYKWNIEHRKQDGTLIGKWVNGELKIGYLYRQDWMKKEEKWIWWNEYQNNFLYSNEIYFGEIENGEPNGQGIFGSPKLLGLSGEIIYHSNYGKYEGEWKDGKMHGQGKLSFLDGRKYEGEWKNGNEHGQGTKTYNDGGKYEGEWRKGIVWNGMTYDKYGHILLKFVNGTIIYE